MSDGAPEMPEPSRVLFAIITNGRAEMHLQCCISILHAQIELMTAKDGSFVAELEFFETLNDALNALHQNKSYAAMFAIKHNTLVAGVFSTKAFASKENVVIAPSPRAGVDWVRIVNHVKDQPIGREPINHLGNVYNMKLEGLPKDNGYTTVKDVDWIDAVFVRREVVDGIAEKHPDIVSEKSAFALDGVYDGKFIPGHKRFVQLYGNQVWADVENQCTVSGPFDYVGCVGSRTVLR